jgi:copper homeostasis protein
MAVKLEVCVDSVDGMLAAFRGGANRIELCSALEVGGLTPSRGQMLRAASVGVPVHALIRSRAGNFVFSPDEQKAMADDIAAARDIGLAGVVIGASLPDGRLDVNALSNLMAAAKGLSVTLHRAFDLVPDFAEAVEIAVGLGVDRVLTSGGAVGAPAGADALASIVEMAKGRVRIMPGAGITAKNVRAMLAKVKADEVHSSCSSSSMLDPRAVALGFGAPERLETDETEVRNLKRELLSP